MAAEEENTNYNELLELQGFIDEFMNEHDDSTQGQFFFAIAISFYIYSSMVKVRDNICIRVYSQNRICGSPPLTPILAVNNLARVQCSGSYLRKICFKISLSLSLFCPLSQSLSVYWRWKGRSLETRWGFGLKWPALLTLFLCLHLSISFYYYDSH